MNNQDERFWSEFPEDELKDPANRQILAALQDVYRVDEADQRSVRRAWGRIASKMEQEQSYISRLDASISQKPFSLVHTQKHVGMRRRIDILVALGIIFLLVGSMLGVIALHNAESRLAGSKQTPVVSQKATPHSVSKQLGTSIGAYSLGMTIKDVQIRFLQFGMACASFPQGKLLSIECTKSTLRIKFKGSSESSGVVQIVSGVNYPGGTAEGLRIGMFFDQFKMLYQGYNVHTEPPDAFIEKDVQFPLYYGTPSIVEVITDNNGTTLTVIFDQRMLVTEIVLQSRAFLQAN